MPKQDAVSKELLKCPGCGQRVHTAPAEGVPEQALRECLKCGHDFFMNLDAAPAQKR